MDEVSIRQEYNRLLSLNTVTTTFTKGDVKEVYFILGGKPYGYAMFYYGNLQDCYTFEKAYIQNQNIRC